MEIGDWTATKTLNPLYRELRELGLETNVAELDAFGFTVIPDVAPAGLVDGLRARLLELSEERSGRAPDVATGESHSDIMSPTGQHLFYLLTEGRIFEEALMQPAVLALITYLLGESCLLSSCTSILKGPGRIPLPLHSDNAFIPAPYPPYAQVANATWVLSDYTKDNGALRFVPGSHRLGRQPKYPEGDEVAVAVEASAGSLVVWHGNTWHGAYPRTTPGLRMNLILYFCRMYLRPQEPYRENCPPELLERNGARFARLMGQHIAYGWKAEGPTPGKLNILAGADQFA